MTSPVLQMDGCKAAKCFCAKEIVSEFVLMCISCLIFLFCTKRAFFPCLLPVMFFNKEKIVLVIEESINTFKFLENQFSKL